MNAAPSPSSIPPTRWPTPAGIHTSPPSSGSNAASTPATPKPGCCATPPRPPSTSQTRRSPPPAPPRPSARTGRSRTPPTTAATSPWARTVRASAPTPGYLPDCAASPSTSSRPTRPTRSARTDTAPVSQASKTCSHSPSFESVEQPCHAASAQPRPKGPVGAALPRQILRGRGRQSSGHLARGDRPAQEAGRCRPATAWNRSS